MKLKKKKWIVTKRAVKTRKARPVAEQYVNILRELPDIVYMIDPEGRFTFLNDSVRIIGYEPEELMGQHFSKILHPDDVKNFSRKYILPKYEGKRTGDENAPKLFDERRTGKRKTHELLIRLIPKKGEEEVIGQVIAFGDVSAAGHYNQGSKKAFLGTLGIIRDVTEKADADNKMRASENKYRILAEHSLQGIAIGVGPELRLVFVNRALAAMVGYTAEELLSFSAHQLQAVIHSDDRAMFFQRFRDRLQGKHVPEQYEFRAVKKNGTEIWVIILANRMEYEGRPAVQAAFVEITERKRAESTLAYQAYLLDNVNDAVIAFDQDFRITLWNRAAEEMYGWKAEEVMGRSRQDVLHTRFTGMDRARAIGILIKTGLYQRELEQRRRDGSTVFVETKAVSLKDAAGMVTGYVSVNRDITERRAIEGRLAESQERYRTLVEGMNEAVMQVDTDDVIQFVNPRFCRLFGYEQNELLGQVGYEIFFDGAGQELIRKKNRLRLRKISNSYETCMRRKNGDQIDVQISGSPVYDAQGAVVGSIGVITDITERKRAEDALRESERRLKEAQAMGRIGNWEYDIESQTLVWSDQTFDLYERDRALGAPTPDDESRYYSAEQNAILRAYAARAIATGQSFHYDLQARLLSGKEVFFAATMHAVKDEGGRVAKLIGTVQDITERRHAEEQTKGSLAEKEVLLRELHHRVKNNMQIIASLLSLQARYLDDEQVKKLYRDSLDRIRSMMLIHERLYTSGNFARIDFSEYVKDLARGLFRSYGIAHGDVDLEMDIHQVVIDMNAAVPCGLIINELVSNSLKHAFPAGRRGKIAIRMQAQDPGHYSLIVSDDGVGLPADLDYRQTQTLGLHLVNTLVEQLEGRLDLRKEPGTQWRIEFKVRR